MGDCRIVKVFYNEHIDESIFDECIKKVYACKKEIKGDMTELSWIRAETREGGVSFNELILNEHCTIKTSFNGDYYVVNGKVIVPDTMFLDVDITLPLREKLHGKTVVATYHIRGVAPVMDLSRATISLAGRCITIFVPYKPKSILQK